MSDQRTPGKPQLDPEINAVGYAVVTFVDGAEPEESIGFSSYVISDGVITLIWEDSTITSEVTYPLMRVEKIDCRFEAIGDAQ